MDKPHNHCCDHEHLCEHEHSHEDLFGETSEVPAVFSHKRSIEFSKKVTGNELCTNLVDWIEAIKLWTSQNKYFIGHIKAFAENGENFNLWISTTGNKVNIKGSTEWKKSILKSCNINITAIVFGTTEDNLRKVTLEKLKFN